ncbi:MAG TPA: hypothetical protein PKW10_07680, partial [Saprospiraceae bacterium]|nr:hypothetical protein [Saprospiraceae bacterium]
QEPVKNQDFPEVEIVVETEVSAVGISLKNRDLVVEDPSTRNLVLAVVVIAITEKADIIAGKTETLINPH